MMLKIKGACLFLEACWVAIMSMVAVTLIKIFMPVEQFVKRVDMDDTNCGYYLRHLRAFLDNYVEKFQEREYLLHQESLKIMKDL